MYTTTTTAIPVVRFDPRADGLRRWFGELEAPIIETIWANGTGPITVKKVHRALTNDRGHVLAYTTVMTTMARLWEKGVLQRDNSKGLAFIYAPRCSQVEYEEIQLAGILDSIGHDVVEEFLGIVVARKKAS